MNRYAKLMLMQNGRREQGNGRNYETENRFRDRRGREHYDNGRYAPMRSEYGREYGREYRDTEIRRGYVDFDTDVDRHDWRPRNEYEPVRNGGDVWYNTEPERRVIGFSGNSSESRYDLPEQQNEMQQRSGTMERGYSSQNGTSPLTKEMAEEWMSKIYNEDGTRGAHWTLEQVKSVMQQRGIECDPVRLWVAINAEYSDRRNVNKKYGVDNLDFYLDSAIAFWLKDHDAVKDKEAAYYTHVVKH